MKLTDSSRLRGPLAAAALAIATGAGLIYWTYAERVVAEAALRDESARLAQARARHVKARQTDSTARELIHQLEILRAGGRLNPPDRRGWQNHFLSLQDTLALDKLDWEITPLHPFDDRPTGTPGSEPANASALVATTLKLRGELGHEAHLLQLLERPSAAPRALFVPRYCRLSRAAAVPGPTLTVDCEIDWISLRLPDEKIISAD